MSIPQRMPMPPHQPYMMPSPSASTAPCPPMPSPGAYAMQAPGGGFPQPFPPRFVVPTVASAQQLRVPPHLPARITSVAAAAAPIRGPSPGMTAPPLFRPTPPSPGIIAPPQPVAPDPVVTVQDNVKAKDIDVNNNDIQR